MLEVNNKCMLILKGNISDNVPAVLDINLISCSQELSFNYFIASNNY